MKWLKFITADSARNYVLAQINHIEYIERNISSDYGPTLCLHFRTGANVLVKANDTVFAEVVEILADLGEK